MAKKTVLQRNKKMANNVNKSEKHLRPRAGSPAARLGREVPIVVEVVVVAPFDVLVAATTIAATADATAAAAGDPTLASSIDDTRRIDRRSRRGMATTTTAGVDQAALAIPVAVFDHMHIGLVPAGSGPMVMVVRRRRRRMT